MISIEIGLEFVVRILILLDERIVYGLFHNALMIIDTMDTN